MNIPQIVVQPEKRYDRRGRPNRGARRHDGRWGRTLALFDRFGIRKRANAIRVSLSDEGLTALRARAAEINVHPSGLVAYLVESAMRESADA